MYILYTYQIPYNYIVIGLDIYWPVSSSPLSRHNATGWWLKNHLEKYEFVNEKDDIEMENNNHVPKHQPDTVSPKSSLIKASQFLAPHILDHCRIAQTSQRGRPGQGAMFAIMLAISESK